MKAHLEREILLAPGMEIGYVVRDAEGWTADIERAASELDAGYYKELLEKAWEVAAFVFTQIIQ